MHLSNMPCPELLKMMKESLHMRIERISGCKRQLEFIQYCFCFQRVICCCYEHGTKRNVCAIVLWDCVLYLLLCVSVKGYLLFLCQVFLFSCILFTVCVLLSITHFFKKLAFKKKKKLAFCLVWVFTWCYLYYSCITAFEIFKVPILIWKKKFVLKKVSVTHH